jgi:NitT/TauT family transport system ATP-binding protein
MTDTVLAIEGVSRVFPGVRGAAPVRALEPVTLAIAENDFITILGPSGCGKSTLLRIVAGLDRPTAGRVLLHGREIRGPGADRGMVFQSYTLFPWLTVAENIAYGLREKGMPARERDSVVTAYIDKVGLRGFENHYPKQLSGGMQQRTAIARALANDPAILLLDEPFGALDNQTRGLMQELLLGIWERERKTVLFVTHDIEEAVYLGDRVIVFTARPGEIKAALDIALPQPRNIEVKKSAEFMAYRNTIWDLLRDEVLKARVQED